MYSKETTIQNSTGLHARPAADFIERAKKYASRITIRSLARDKAANAKSIVHLLALGLKKDSRVEISAEGEDEQEAVDGLVDFIQQLPELHP